MEASAFLQIVVVPTYKQRERVTSFVLAFFQNVCSCEVLDRMVSWAGR